MATKETRTKHTSTEPRQSKTQEYKNKSLWTQTQRIHKLTLNNNFLNTQVPSKYVNYINFIGRWVDVPRQGVMLFLNVFCELNNECMNKVTRSKYLHQTPIQHETNYAFPASPHSLSNPPGYKKPFELLVFHFHFMRKDLISVQFCFVLKKFKRGKWNLFFSFF